MRSTIRPGERHVRRGDDMLIPLGVWALAMTFSWAMPHPWEAVLVGSVAYLAVVALMWFGELGRAARRKAGESWSSPDTQVVVGNVREVIELRGPGSGRRVLVGEDDTLVVIGPRGVGYHEHGVYRRRWRVEWELDARRDGSLCYELSRGPAVRTRSVDVPWEIPFGIARGMAAERLRWALDGARPRRY